MKSNFKPRHRKRRRSFHEEGDAHELTFCCHNRLDLFDDDFACQTFLDALDVSRRELKFEVWAYVIMPNHIRLVLWPSQKEVQMASILQKVKQPVSRRMLSRYQKENSRCWTGLGSAMDIASGWPAAVTTGILIPQRRFGIP